MLQLLTAATASLVFFAADKDHPKVLSIIPSDLHPGIGLVRYLKWTLASWTFFEINALLNEWAENRWSWKGSKSDWKWDREIAVVTGGSRGIGASVAKQLVANGIKVAVLDIIPLSEEFTEDELELVRHYPCDVTSTDAVRSAAEGVRSDLGIPSILINNAGIGNAWTVLDVPPDYLRKLLDINLLSHWITVKEFLPGMLAMKKGHVMTVASLSSFCALAGAVDYCCTKAALVAFHEGLTQELKHRYGCPQIKTSIVYPNWTRSAITTHSAIKEGIKKVGAKLVEPEEVATAMVRQILTAKSGQLILGPQLAPKIRAFPIWLQELIRDSQARVVSGNGSSA